MNKLHLQQFAELDSEQIEMYWLAGLTHNEKNAWFVRSVARGMSTGRFYMQSLPIGMWPILTLGMVFANGNLLSIPARGMMSKAAISDMSLYEEITSADIPPALYSFKDNGGGVQRLFRYSTHQGEILIPTMELIRYLFLHNRTLANALMRPGALNLLFHPELPGYSTEREIQFSAEMPKSCLSNQFAQEFAWLALDPDARHSWDSVSLESQGQQYVTFIPPPLKNSEWTFRAIRYGNCWLVLELIHLTGKRHPCDRLCYGHPSLKRAVHVPDGNKNSGDEDDNDGGETNTQKERITYNYQLDDGQAGSKSDRNQQMLIMNSKQSEFDRDITIKKLLIDINNRPAKLLHKATTSTIQLVEKKQTIIVSAGEQSSNADLPPLNFNLLTPANWDSLGDLDALTNTVHQMANRRPEAQFAMSLCQLKAGRAFSMANRMPRVALVVTITAPNKPLIVLLDIERTGKIALSLMVLRFHGRLTFEELESNVKLMLDGLIDASGHWDHEIEKKVADFCSCERLPKILTPRDNAKLPGQTLVWAMKLIQRLKLGTGQAG